MSVRHCAATTAPRISCPNCYAEQSHKDNVRSSAVGKQLKQKKYNSLSLSLAQHRLLVLDLFWANFFVRVQLTSLLLISHWTVLYISVSVVVVLLNVLGCRLTY